MRVNYALDSVCLLSLYLRACTWFTLFVWYSRKRKHFVRNRNVWSVKRPTVTFSVSASALYIGRSTKKSWRAHCRHTKNQLQCIFFCTNNIICERLDAGKRNPFNRRLIMAFRFYTFFLLFHFNKSSNQFVMSKHNAIHLNKAILCTDKKKTRKKKQRGLYAPKAGAQPQNTQQKQSIIR